MKMSLFPKLMFAGLLFVIIGLTILVVSYFANNSMIAEWLTQPQPPGKVYPIKSGATYATIKGQGTDTVVFITGLGASSAEWWSIQDTLSKNFQTVTYDRPGYTWSQPAEDVGFEKQIHIFQELMITLNIRKNIVLVGHNLGAAIAKRIFEANSDEFKGVIFIDPLIDPAEAEMIDPKWRREFIDQSKNLERYAKASRMGFFRFLNLTPYDVPEPIRPIVLNNLANPASAHAVINEYKQMVYDPSHAKSPICTSQENTANTCETRCLQHAFSTPIIIIQHNADQNIELMKSFGAPAETAKQIEDLWQKTAKNYECSKSSKTLSAKKSVFDIHINEPDLIVDAVKNLAK